MHEAGCIVGLGSVYFPAIFHVFTVVVSAVQDYSLTQTHFRTGVHKHLAPSSQSDYIFTVPTKVYGFSLW